MNLHCVIAHLELNFRSVFTLASQLLRLADEVSSSSICLHFTWLGGVCVLVHGASPLLLSC